MLNDKKIKRELNKELQPSISPDQFCLEAGISLNTQEAPNSKQRGKWFAKVFVPIASVAAVSLSIVLPLTLSRYDDAVVNQPKYGENDVVYKMTEIENLYADESILMFNQSFVQLDFVPYLITPTDSNMKLGYSIPDVLYAEVVDGFPSFALMFNYIVRCYDGYTVSSAEIYSHADKTYTQNGIQFNYGLANDTAGDFAYISFEYKKYDYYIRIRSYGGITEINDESVQLFLQKAFAEEKQSDEAVNRRQVNS